MDFNNLQSKSYLNNKNQKSSVYLSLNTLKNLLGSTSENQDFSPPKFQIPNQNKKLLSLKKSLQKAYKIKKSFRVSPSLLAKSPI